MSVLYWWKESIQLLVIFSNSLNVTPKTLVLWHKTFNLEAGRFLKSRMRIFIVPTKHITSNSLFTERRKNFISSINILSHRLCSTKYRQRTPASYFKQFSNVNCGKTSQRHGSFTKWPSRFFVLLFYWKAPLRAVKNCKAHYISNRFAGYWEKFSISNNRASGEPHWLR